MTKILDTDSTPEIDELKNRVLVGDCTELMKLMPDGFINTCVTSPPYFALRDYGVNGQIGLEGSPDQYIERLVSVFREVKRLLRPDGTLWINIGDSYFAGTTGNATASSSLGGTLKSQIESAKRPSKLNLPGIKPKDLIGIPWMLAFALRADGWYLRSDIIWAKKNCMPESVTDRPTKAHEYIFLLSKSPKYYYDYDAIKEPAIYDVDGTGTAARKARANSSNKLLPTSEVNGIRPAGFKDARKMNGKHSSYDEDFTKKKRPNGERQAGFKSWDQLSKADQCIGYRNKRDVWQVATAAFKDAHFATFPEELIVPCIKAGCPEGGIVLDPFGGACTTGLVAQKQGRNFIICELNPKYAKMGQSRIHNEMPLFYPIKP